MSNKLKKESRLSDTLLVGIDFSNSEDKGVLIVGRRNFKTGQTDIVNAFQGEEAMELYKKLITKDNSDN